MRQPLMNETFTRKGRPLSLTEKVEMGIDIGISVNTPDDFICGDCFGEDLVMPIHTDGTCLRCGGRTLIRKTITDKVPALRGYYERKLLFRLQMRSKMNDSNNAVSTLSLAKMTPDEFERAVKASQIAIMQSRTMVLSHIKPEDQPAAAYALAEAEVATGLLSALKQITIINTGSDSNPKYGFFVGYTGYEVITQRFCIMNGEEARFINPVPLSQAEIELRMSNRCPKCQGRGEVWNWDKKAWVICQPEMGDGKSNKRDYKGCGGSGWLNPDQYRAVKAILYYTADGRLADQLKMPYEPEEGTAIAYVWEAAPNTQDVFFLAAKRARTNVLRRKFPDFRLSMRNGARIPVRVWESDDLTDIDLKDVVDSTAREVPTFEIDLTKSAVNETDITLAKEVVTYLGFHRNRSGGDIMVNVPNLVLGVDVTWEKLTPIQMHNLITYLHRSYALADAYKMSDEPGNAIRSLFHGTDVNVDAIEGNQPAYRAALQAYCRKLSGQGLAWGDRHVEPPTVEPEVVEVAEA